MKFLHHLIVERKRTKRRRKIRSDHHQRTVENQHQRKMKRKRKIRSRHQRIVENPIKKHHRHTVDDRIRNHHQNLTRKVHQRIAENQMRKRRKRVHIDNDHHHCIVDLLLTKRRKAAKNHPNHYTLGLHHHRHIVDHKRRHRLFLCHRHWHERNEIVN